MTPSFGNGEVILRPEVQSYVESHGGKAAQLRQLAALLHISAH
jgi:hypothetical protein